MDVERHRNPGVIGKRRQRRGEATVDERERVYALRELVQLVVPD